MKFKLTLLMSLCFLLASFQSIAQSTIRVKDDKGGEFEFLRPVSRIISLAPHATELLFAAGASTQIIGTVSFSDYPVAAKSIPLVGSYNKIDIEAILSKKPELIVAWSSGNSKEQLEKLRQLGIPVFISQPEQFPDVAENIRNMGRILGTEKIAQKAANDFLYGLDELKKRYPATTSVSVFYQVWNEPLMTISDNHLIGQVIKFCSGKNVFGELPVISPRVSVEAVLDKNPQVIVIGMTEDRGKWIDQWKKWPILKAVKNNHIFPVNADLITRQSPRILQGIKIMCEHFEQVRETAK